MRQSSVGWLLALFLWAPLASAGGEPPPVEADAPEPSEAQGDEIVLRAFLDGTKPGGGTLVVQAQYDRRGQVTMPDPSAENLVFEPDGAPLAEVIGDKNVLTARWVFRGPKGSYEIAPMVASWTFEGQKRESTSRSIFVDLDTEPPRDGPLADILEPPEIWRPPYLLITSMITLFLGGLLIAFRPRRVSDAPPPPPEPADVAALREWKAIRSDVSLTIDDKAREIARIFREYVEAVLGFEASSHTTSELMAHLQSLQHLPEGNAPRAKRVLRAADRVKFAEERPRDDVEGWLDELDADLRAFIDSTRPRHLSELATDERGGRRER